MKEMHKDDRGVSNFSKAMRRKLAQARIHKGRGGWEDKKAVSNTALSDQLREHVEKGDPIDVANFAMMLHQRGESIIGKHRFKVELDSVSARLNMVSRGADRQLRSANAELKLLRDALHDIVEKVGQSRTETRRLNWIETRATSALEGKQWTKGVFCMPDPKNGQPKAERLSRQVHDLGLQNDHMKGLLKALHDRGDLNLPMDLLNEIELCIGEATV